MAPGQQGTRMTTFFKIGKGAGWICREGTVCMERCADCGRENYALMVLSGMCAWCGFDANKKPETT